MPFLSYFYVDTSAHLLPFSLMLAGVVPLGKVCSLEPDRTRDLEKGRELVVVELGAALCHLRHYCDLKNFPLEIPQQLLEYLLCRFWK